MIAVKILPSLETVGVIKSWDTDGTQRQMAYFESQAYCLIAVFKDLRSKDKLFSSAFKWKTVNAGKNMRKMYICSDL